MQRYKEWCFTMFPHMNFENMVERIERMSHVRRVKARALAVTTRSWPERARSATGVGARQAVRAAG
jgi:hypothetical protein